MKNRIKSLIWTVSLIIFSYKLSGKILDDINHLPGTLSGGGCGVYIRDHMPSHEYDSLYSILRPMLNAHADSSRITELDSLEYITSHTYVLDEQVRPDCK